MGLFDSFRLKLNVELTNQVLLPGSELKGNVVVIVSSDASILGIRIRINGHEETHTHTTSGFHHHQPNQHYNYHSCCAHYIHQVITLAGHTEESGKRESFIIPEGRYVYPFSFELPEKLLPSIQLRQTHRGIGVIYYVEAYVDIAYGSNRKKRVPFTIVQAVPPAQLALNNVVQAQTFTIPLKTAFQDRGVINLQLLTNETKYVPGHTPILCRLVIDLSQCDSDIVLIEFQLVHHVFFSADGNSKAKKEVLDTVLTTVQEVAAGSAAVTVEGQLLIPQMPVPSLVGKHFRSTYEVRAHLKVDAWSYINAGIPIIVFQKINNTNQVQAIPDVYDYVEIPRRSMPELYYSVPEGATGHAPAPIPIPEGVVFQSTVAKENSKLKTQRVPSPLASGVAHATQSTEPI